MPKPCVHAGLPQYYCMRWVCAAKLSTKPGGVCAGYALRNCISQNQLSDHTLCAGGMRSEKRTQTATQGFRSQSAPVMKGCSPSVGRFLQVAHTLRTPTPSSLGLGGRRQREDRGLRALANMILGYAQGMRPPTKRGDAGNESSQGAGGTGNQRK